MLAIISATPEEISAIVDSLTAVSTREIGRRRYHVGKFCDTEVVAVFSRWGKVAAAATVMQTIVSYAAREVIFTGVAGAIDPGLSIGDVVVGSELVQHDMDASPVFPRYEIPLLGKAVLAADSTLCARLSNSAREFLTHDLKRAVPESELAAFNISSPAVHRGLIASGDKFFARADEVDALRMRLPAALCVEMEGAAVAQVCEEHAVRFGVLRTISDTADHNAVHDFPRFSGAIAGRYSAGILARFVKG